MKDIVNFDLGQPKSSRKKRKRKAQRHWWRYGLGLVLLLGIARWSVKLWLPPAVKELGQRIGWEVTFDRMDVSFLGGQITLRGLTLAPHQEASDAVAPEPLGEFDYAVLDVSVSKLLRGALRVHRAEIDGGRLNLQRDSSGRWNFLPDQGAGEDRAGAA